MYISGGITDDNNIQLEGNPGTQGGRIYLLCSSLSLLRDKPGTAEDIVTSGNRRSRKSVYSLLYYFRGKLWIFPKETILL